MNVDEVGPEIRDLPDSASQGLELNSCAPMPRSLTVFYAPIVCELLVHFSDRFSFPLNKKYMNIIMPFFQDHVRIISLCHHLNYPEACSLAFLHVSMDTDSVPMFLLSKEFQFGAFLYELYLRTVLQSKEKGTIL